MMIFLLQIVQKINIINTVDTAYRKDGKEAGYAFCKI